MEHLLRQQVVRVNKDPGFILAFDASMVDLFHKLGADGVDQMLGHDALPGDFPISPGIPTPLFARPAPTDMQIDRATLLDVAAAPRAHGR
jgi:hypothetical protein